MRPRSTSDQLEQEIESEPDAVDSYLVYSDWLQEHGDPRGQLIALHHAADDQSAGQFLNSHRREILGLLDEDYHFLDEIAWHMGYLESVTVHVDDGHPATTASDVLRSLLASPSARFLQKLRVRHPYGDEGVPDMLAKHNLASLKGLDLAPSGELARPRLELAGLWQKAPNLRALRINSSRVVLGDFELPHLNSLELALDTLPAIAPIAHRLAALESLGLELADGDPNLDGVLDLRFEKLKRFAFYAHTEALLISVLRSLIELPFFGRLERLALGDVTEQSVAYLTSQLPRLGHLESLAIRVSGAAVPWDPHATWNDPRDDLEAELLRPLKNALGDRLQQRLSTV